MEREGRPNRDQVLGNSNTKATNKIGRANRKCEQIRLRRSSHEGRKKTGECGL